MIYAHTPDYDLRRLWKANIAQVQRSWNEPWVRAKVESHLMRTEGFVDPHTVDQILALVRTNTYVASTLCKNPGRQSSHQKLFGAWLATLPSCLVDEAKELVNKGPGSLHVFGGKLLRITGNDDRHAAADGKSIDFTWKTGAITIYAMHKHTDEEGGAQDNQHQDARTFLKEARDNIAHNERFVAVCDGPYYQRPSRTNQKLTRLQALRSICSPNSFALSSAELPRWLMMVAAGQA